MPVTEVVEVRETGDLPLLTGGSLRESEELRPKQEKRLLMGTGREERLREGRTVHDAHWRPSFLSCHDGREQKPHEAAASLARRNQFIKSFSCQVFSRTLTSNNHLGYRPLQTYNGLCCLFRRKNRATSDASLAARSRHEAKIVPTHRMRRGRTSHGCL
jgi:hypothetical protein